MSLYHGGLKGRGTHKTALGGAHGSLKPGQHVRGALSLLQPVPFLLGSQDQPCPPGEAVSMHHTVPQIRVPVCAP